MASHNGECGINLDLTKEGQPSRVVPSQATVEDNACFKNGMHGIVVNTGGVQLRRNTCNVNSHAGIALSTSRAAAVNNVALLNEGFGIAAFGGPAWPAYGWHRISANSVAGNRRSDFHDATGTSPRS